MLPLIACDCSVLRLTATNKRQLPALLLLLVIIINTYGLFRPVAA